MNLIHATSLRRSNRCINQWLLQNRLNSALAAWNSSWSTNRIVRFGFVISWCGSTPVWFVKLLIGSAISALNLMRILSKSAIIGLIRSIERFDPGQGCAFSSFAVPYIRGEMLHFLRDRGTTVKIPRRWQDLQKEGQKRQAELIRQYGRQPTDIEMAEAIDVSVQEWRQVKMANKNRMPLSLDATVSHQVDSSITLGDTLPDIHYMMLQGLEEDRQQIQRAMNQLEEKTRSAIEFVFFKGLSRKEVAERIGVSPMTVTRRIQRGVEQMVVYLQPQQGLQSDP